MPNRRTDKTKHLLGVNASNREEQARVIAFYAVSSGPPNPVKEVKYDNTEQTGRGFQKKGRVILGEHWEYPIKMHLYPDDNKAVKSILTYIFNYARTLQLTGDTLRYIHTLIPHIDQKAGSITFEEQEAAVQAFNIVGWIPESFDLEVDERNFATLTVQGTGISMDDETILTTGVTTYPVVRKYYSRDFSLNLNGVAVTDLKKKFSISGNWGKVEDYGLGSDNPIEKDSDDMLDITGSFTMKFVDKVQRDRIINDTKFTLEAIFTSQTNIESTNPFKFVVRTGATYYTSGLPEKSESVARLMLDLGFESIEDEITANRDVLYCYEENEGGATDMTTEANEAGNVTFFDGADTADDFVAIGAYRFFKGIALRNNVTPAADLVIGDLTFEFALTDDFATTQEVNLLEETTGVLTGDGYLRWCDEIMNDIPITTYEGKQAIWFRILNSASGVTSPVYSDVDILDGPALEIEIHDTDDATT